MAVSSLQSNAIGFRAEYALAGGGTPRTMWGREAACQSFVAGAVLIRSSGRIATAAADPTADIVGVAKHAASGTTDDILEYWPAAGIVFSATLEDQSNEDHALVIGNMFTDYGCQVDDDGVWYVDENETTSTAVMVIAPVKDEDITDATVRARVLCVFLADVLSQQT